MIKASLPSAVDSESGFSLLETIAALAILSMALVPLLAPSNHKGAVNLAEAGKSPGCLSRLARPFQPVMASASAHAIDPRFFAWTLNWPIRTIGKYRFHCNCSAGSKPPPMDRNNAKPLP